MVAFRVCSPSVDGTDLVLPNQTVSTQKSELACKSITAADYDGIAGGDVVFTASLIVLESEFEVAGGIFAAVNP